MDPSDTTTAPADQTQNHLSFVLVVIGLFIAVCVGYVAYGNYQTNQKTRTAELRSCVEDWAYSTSSEPMNC